MELLEYGYLVKDEDPMASTFEVYVPKLSGMQEGSSKSTTQTADTSAIANEGAAATSASTQSKSTITARVSPEIMIAHRHKFHDCPGNCINLVHKADTCHTGTSTLKVCHHFHHDHHWPHQGDKGMIPANSRVIVLFMNHDMKDAIVTRIICDFPSGGEPAPPDEHR